MLDLALTSDCTILQFLVCQFEEDLGNISSYQMIGTLIFNIRREQQNFWDPGFFALSLFALPKKQFSLIINQRSLPKESFLIERLKTLLWESLKISVPKTVIPRISLICWVEDIGRKLPSMHQMPLKG